LRAEKNEQKAQKQKKIWTKYVPYSHVAMENEGNKAISIASAVISRHLSVGNMIKLAKQITCCCSGIQFAAKTQVSFIINKEQRKLT
jgi:hypothetical protein